MLQIILRILKKFFLSLHNMLRLAECPICFNAFENLVPLECNHTFCKYCISKWCCLQSSTCPMCRSMVQKLYPSQTFHFFHPYEEYGLIIEMYENYPYVCEIVPNSQASQISDIQGRLIQSLNDIIFYDIHEIESYVDRQKTLKRMCKVKFFPNTI